MSHISPYRYSALSPGRIRLLRLLSNEDKTAHIECQLFDYSLQESDSGTHPYDALSYVWGSSDKPRAISIGAHDMPVTETLFAALSRLRHRAIERVIWIDALCINQKDDREKEKQIQLMAKIYAQANRVVVWLGEAADDSDRALKGIRAAGAKRQADTSNDVGAVLALLRRPWFRRIWVLQEVGAARHIQVVCGSTRVEGHAFCLGIEALVNFHVVQLDLQSSVRSVVFLMRGAIFRSEYETPLSGKSSLEICPLGELVDMYHTREATQRHDKVYALLGMSSDDPGKAGIVPNYREPWEDLFRRLIETLLCGKIHVQVWSDREIAVIQGKGCVLGKVASVQNVITWDDGQGIEVAFTDLSRQSQGVEEKGRSWVLQNSAKAIRDGDLICLIQGASQLTIIRACRDYFSVIVLAARPPENLPMGSENIKWPELLQAGELFTRDFLLVWDWERSPGNTPGDFETLMQSNNLVSPKADPLDMATRVWDVALVVGDVGEHEKAGEMIREATEGYKIAFGQPRSPALSGRYGLTPLSWASEKGHDTIVSQVLGRVNPDLKDSQFGRTPLSWAAGGGHAAALKLLLETGKVAVDSKDQSDQTPLSWAAAGGHEAVVKLLLEAGGTVDSKDRDGQSSLSRAAAGGHETVVELLLETGDLASDSKDLGDLAPLSQAASNGHLAVTKLLLRRFWPDSMDSQSGRTPLSWAAGGGHVAVVKQLFETRIVVPGRKDRNGRTGLSWAAMNGHEAVVKLWLECGSDEVDQKDTQHGRTPLWWAAAGGHAAVVKLLLETGEVELGCTDADDQTPLSCAAYEGHEAVVKLLLETDEVKPDRRDKDGLTPLAWAAMKGHEAVVKLLLTKGKAEADSIDNQFSRTPLWWAAAGGHAAVVKLLLETGEVEPDRKDRNGRTGLSWAAMNGHEAVVKLLLASGRAAVDSKDLDDRTPLWWAADRGQDAMVKLMESSTR